MPTQANLLPQAIKALDINVPVLKWEQKGNTITLYLYGHTDPITWTKRSPRRQRTTTRRSNVQPANVDTQPS